MATKHRRKSDDQPPRRPKLAPVEDNGSRPVASPTALVVEAMLTGVLPSSARARPEEIPHEDDTIRVGDPDDDALANEYVGEDTPGGSTTTPDQNDVDAIGRVYGLQDEDSSGALRSGAEVLTRRDRNRSELQPPRRRG
jgi:hypothetical protein